jgi:hypothetical protein
LKYKQFETILDIDWIDSVSTNGWTYKEKINETFNPNDLRYTKSCGYFLKEDKESIMICLSLSRDCYAETIQIPKISIKKIRRLK